VIILSTAVACLVCEQYRAIAAQRGVRRGGFAPALTDEEVIIIEICGEFVKCGADKDIVVYVRAHYQVFFPQLRDCGLFVRQAANRWPVKAAIQERLTVVSEQAHDEVQVIDTLPLPVCGYTRRRRDRCFKPHADYGHCAAKTPDYYGFKLGLRVARGHDHRPSPLGGPSARQPVARRPAGRLQGHRPPDKGFIGAALGQQGLCPHPRRRQTVGSHLTERFAVARIHTHDLWHFQHRLIRKVLAHTVGVFLNLQLGWTPLNFDGLLAA